MGNKRFKDQILRQILETGTKDGASKTQIVYKCGLNFRTIRPYLELISRNDLMVKIEGNIPKYRTTGKGEEALLHLRALEELIWD